MAPKGGKGGGGSSGGSSGGFSSSSCPRAFKSDSEIYSTPIATFVAYCLLWFAFLVLIIARSKTFKKHPKAKVLIGPMYSASVWLAFISYSFLIIATLLRECDTTPFYSFYYWVIFVDLLFYIGQYLLLVLVLYGLNTLLRDQLGTSPSYFRIIYYALLSLMGILTVAYLGLQIYNYAAVAARVSTGQRLQTKGEEATQLRIAYFVLYLVTVAVAGGLAIKSILSMRSRSLATGNLLTKTSLLIFSMTIWLLFLIIDWASVLPDSTGFDREVYIAFMYIEYIFQIVSWTLLLFIAKSTVLKGNSDHVPPTTTVGVGAPVYPTDGNLPQAYTPQPTYQQGYTPGMVQQPSQYQQQPQFHGQQPQMYAYPVNANGGQQYYYHQQPVYSNGPSPVNGPTPVNGNVNTNGIPVQNGGGGYMVQVK